MNQTTILNGKKIEGVGLHTGNKSTLTLNPAVPNSGIVFVDQLNGRKIEASHKNYQISELCTAITDGVSTIKTIEHLMAAINAMDIDNLEIGVTGGEVPILDGSSSHFIDHINQCGIVELDGYTREYIKINQPIHFRENDKSVSLLPSDKPMFSFDIDFSEKKIGAQSYSMELNKENFINEVAFARTFGFMSDVEKLWAAGLAKGGSKDNAVLVGLNGEILNESGLRHKQEFVRHKILDAIGDLMLAGKRIIGHFVGNKSSHRLTAILIQMLFERPGSWELVKA